MLKQRMRNSNIEILRIMSMIFIVLSHYSFHGGIVKQYLPVGLNRILLSLFVLGNIGVILFVLISGYFLIESDKFSLKKLLKIVLQVWFYSVIIYILSCIFGLTTFSWYDLIKNLLPLTSKSYWFATCYVTIYIFHPFINKFLHSLSKKQYQLFLITSIIMFSLVPTILFTPNANFYGNELIQLLLFYSIGAYLKKYSFTYLTNKKNNCLLIASASTLILSVILINLLSIKIPEIGIYVNHFYERYSIVAIIFSVSLFIAFIYRKHFSNRFINSISSTMFGIYLVHDNNYIRSFIWQKVLHCEQFASSNLLILHAILSVILIFLICITLDLIRQFLIEKPLFKKINNVLDNFQNIIENKLNNI